MVQDSLVDYVSSQLKLGVSREAVKSALVSAGWVEADVEDTLKKVQGGSAGTPAASGPAPMMMSKPVSSSPSSASIKVSDLVSASGSAVSFGSSSSPKATTASASMGTMSAMSSMPITTTTTTKKTVTKSEPMAMSSNEFVAPGVVVKKSGMMMKIILIVLVVIFAGLAGYLYYENMGLSGQIASINAQTASTASQLAALNTQVQTMDASNTALAAQTASLTAMNADLAANLSFAAVPPASSSTPPFETVTVSGTLKQNKALSYTLTTQYGVLVVVENSKDAKVDAALKPLFTSTSTTSVQLTGTHVPGSVNLIVTSVNGNVLQS